MASLSALDADIYQNITDNLVFFFSRPRRHDDIGRMNANVVVLGWMPPPVVVVVLCACRAMALHSPVGVSGGGGG